MKIIIRISLSILIISNYSCHRPVMRTLADAKKIKENQEKYVNHSLSKLLKDIKPAITYVIPNPSSNSNVRLGSIIFRFQDSTTIQTIRSQGKLPPSITVLVKEPFEWDYKKRPADKKLAWTPEDAERLKNLTVVGIRVWE